MVGSILCADSATPAGLKPFPAGYKCAQFYIGERTPIKTPTPHIWSKSDVDGLPKGIGRYPMFVGTPAIGAKGNATVEAIECLEALYQIGMPLHKVVGLDMETAVSPEYVSEFGRLCNHYDVYVWVYGSKSAVFKNPRLNGYDVADYTKVPHIVPGSHATQWADSTELGTTFDARSIKWWSFVHRIWR